MKIAIVGLGLIGGSMAKALKTYTGHTVFGLDNDSRVIELALLSGAINREIEIEELKGIDVVFVCLYPHQTIDFILKAIPHMQRGTVVADICGIKSAIIAAVGKPLENSGIKYVSTHPMAGKEFSGFSYSSSELFKGASFIIATEDGVKSKEPHVEIISKLAYEMQFGEIVFSAPEHHDRVIAYTSQLAHIVSNAYVKSPSAKERYGFSAGSYKDLTRVAMLNEEMWSPLFMLNREPLIYEIGVILENLQKYKSALENNDEDSLKRLLKEGRKIKEEIL